MFPFKLFEWRKHNYCYFYDLHNSMVRLNIYKTTDSVYWTMWKLLCLENLPSSLCQPSHFLDHLQKRTLRIYKLIHSHSYWLSILVYCIYNLCQAIGKHFLYRSKKTERILITIIIYKKMNLIVFPAFYLICYFVALLDTFKVKNSSIIYILSLNSTKKVLCYMFY